MKYLALGFLALLIGHTVAPAFAGGRNCTTNCYQYGSSQQCNTYCY
jgi:hypothetical protein